LGADMLLYTVPAAEITPPGKTRLIDIASRFTIRELREWLEEDFGTSGKRSARRFTKRSTYWPWCTNSHGGCAIFPSIATRRSTCSPASSPFFEQRCLPLESEALMSRSLRPIREDWGPHTSYFVENAVPVLRMLAGDLAQCSVTDVGWFPDHESFTLDIESATQFLGYLCEHTPDGIVRELSPLLKSARIHHFVGDLESLLSNLRQLAVTDAWPSWIEDGDILTLRIDV